MRSIWKLRVFFLRFAELFTLVTKCPADALKPQTMYAIMTGFCQQATEIIDRTRGMAASLFWKLIYQ